MDEIGKLLNNISWNCSQSLQDSAINELSTIDDDIILKLIQPGDKSHWENAAKIFVKIGYPRIIIAVPGLLEWIKDMNWPGANIIMEVLGGIEENVLVPYIEDALIKAKNENDTVWIAWIKELLNKKNLTISDFKHKDAFEILKLADW